MYDIGTKASHRLPDVTVFFLLINRPIPTVEKADGRTSYPGCHSLRSSKKKYAQSREQDFRHWEEFLNARESPLTTPPSSPPPETEAEEANSGDKSGGEGFGEPILNAGGDVGTGVSLASGSEETLSQGQTEARVKFLDDEKYHSQFSQMAGFVKKEGLWNEFIQYRPLKGKKESTIEGTKFILSLEGKLKEEVSR